MKKQVKMTPRGHKDDQNGEPKYFASLRAAYDYYTKDTYPELQVSYATFCRRITSDWRYYIFHAGLFQWCVFELSDTKPPHISESATQSQFST